MSGDSKLAIAAKLALRKRLGEAVSLDSKGYVSRPEQNLLPDVAMDHFESDLRAGDGNELKMKFCASHSSTALAVNSFAWFRPAEKLQHLTVLEHANAKTLQFERKCQIFRGGRAPNLDVWVEYSENTVAIESKFTEYFKQKKPAFTPAYERLETLSDSCWWKVYQAAKEGERSYLDCAQLVKHYFGLRRLQAAKDPPGNIRFLYLYWEPVNADELAVCQAHRREIAMLTEATAESEIRFHAMSYSTLWRQWEQIPELGVHVRNLQSRYEVEVSV
ncbi:MAG: hypothetical protein R3C18_04505 [Planctomycetaceae bacterium]